LAFIHGLTQQANPVNDAFITKILQIPVSKRRGPIRRKRKPLHFGKRTWIISAYPWDEDRYPEEHKHVEKAEKAVKEKLHKARAAVTWVRCTGKDRFRTLARAGDTIIGIEFNATGKRVTVLPPVAILLRQDRGHWTRFYHELPDDSMSWTSFERKIRQLGIRHIKKTSAKELTPRDAALIGVAWE